MFRLLLLFLFFFFNDTATTEIYTLSLHDALPISICERIWRRAASRPAESSATLAPCDCARTSCSSTCDARIGFVRSEEHTSELQSQSNLVCRLLLEKKKNQVYIYSLVIDILI